MCTPQCICENLGGLAFEEAIKAGKYVRHYSKNLQKLKDKLKDLDDCMDIITREVSVANVRGDEILVNVSRWQTDANELKADIEQLIRESTIKASISYIACSCPNIVWRYKFSKQAEEKIAEAVELIGKYNNFNHQISHPRSHYAENLQKLKDKLRDLEDCRGTITRKVSEANGRGDEIEVNVSHWQTDANSLKDDIEQLIRESTTKANICATSECPRPDITWQYNFSKQAEEKIAEADGLIIKCNNFNQISHPRPRPSELESLSDKNYVNFDSRASIFKDVMDALKDSNVNMIGVFGLGGVGKTTLVKEVAEQMRKDGTFKQVAMAVVSKDLNVKEVQSRLADNLNFEFEAKADYQGRRATELWNKLENGDKYLIILDDIWEQVKMEAIGIPCTKKKEGCKVVFTSRNEDLLRITMKVDRNFPIAELPEEEGWNLFKKKVGNTIESRQEIYSLARKVCRKCKGLPVAINALGAALEEKQEHAWTTALDKLDKYMLTKIEGVDQSVLASLRVSYDMLHSAEAKSCFLLCCLFAEDAEIPIDELMRLCVARNLLDQNPHTLDKARNAVRTVVDTLKSASLLTTGGHGTVVKIHDVIRDVGISIAREEEAFLVEHGALRWPRNPTNEPLYKAMSLSFKNIKGLPDGLVYPRIHTLMVDNTNFPYLEVGDNFFNGMMQLVVLTVTRMRMQPLPSSLVKLTDLKMLYLNKCKLADIAILVDLKSNLEVLSLRGSSIKELPPEIGQLTSLRVLDLQDCGELMVIPRGVISNLTGLEEVYFPMTFDKWGATTDEQQDTSSRDNVSLEELRESQQDTSSSHNASLEELRESLANAQLTTLHIHVPNVKLLPKEDLKFADLKGFRISVGSKFDYSEALISRTCMLKLEGIQLRNEFIPLVDKAEVLVLKPESSVHPLRLFNKLTVLIIEHFKLKYLFSPTTARGLVHLEVLQVTSCEIMEGIVGCDGQKDENEITGEVKFSKLKRLKLKSLLNLISFFAKKEEMGTTMGSFSARAQPLFNEQVIFPVLERLTIDGLSNIIKIWDKQLVAVWQEQGSFCQLTSVNVNKCEKLMHVFPSNMHPLLKNLEELEVEECETMKGIAEFEGERDEDGVRNEVASLAQEHLEILGVTEIQDKQPLPEPRKEVESLCRPVNNDDIIVFPRLKEVILRSLPQLKSFYNETQGFFSHKVIFPVLERLTIDDLGNIIKIWDKQLVAVWQEQGSFCQLTNLEVNHCSKLTHVFPSNMHPLLKNLEKLEVDACKTMKGIAEFEGERDEDRVRNEVGSPAREHLEMVGVTEIQDKQLLPEPIEEVESLYRPVNNDDIIVFPRLKEVKLCSLPQLKSFYSETFFSHKVAFPVLERLFFLSLDKITRIWDNQPLSELEKKAKSFCQLMEIEVYYCNQLEYVLPSCMLPQLENLEELHIESCSKMEVIISNNPQEKEATNNNDTIRFPQLKKVKLCSLPNLKSFICSDETQLLFANKVAFPVLERLFFWDLDKITRIWDDQPFSELEKKAKSFCQLIKIDVYYCNQLEYVLPSYMLLQLENLKELHIERCSKMEVIISNNPQEKEATTNNDTIRFAQLKKVELWSLPNLKSVMCSDETQLFFSNKVIFPVLKKLSIRKVHKIIEIWDKQSIAVLEEQGSFCQLTDLDVSECEKLIHVFPSKMHSPLKNLKVLRVSDCPTMEGIVEFEGETDEDGLINEVCFSELSSLELSNLPNLESFCTKLGKAGTTEGNSTIHALSLINRKVIFPMLKNLSIRKVHKINEIWDKQSIAVLEEQGSFCQLTDLDVSECEKLIHVFPSKMHSPLKNLKVLRVSDCPTMEGIVESEGEIDEDGLINEVCFSELSSMELSNLPNLESFCTKLGKAGTAEGNSTIHALPLFNGKVPFPVLETLKFKDLHKITRIWNNQSLSKPEKEAKSFCKLMVIKVENCHQLEYVLPLYMLSQLKNLQNLTISGSTEMEVIISNNLKEKEVANNDTIRFPQLKEVELLDLPNLKSFICSETQLFFSNKVIFPVLKKLSIRKIHKIIEIWDKQSIAVLEEEGSFSQLTDLDVSECEKLIHVFPSKMHSPLKNLKVLRVSDCPTIEGIVEFEGEIDEDGLRNEVCFSELSSLELSSLPNLKSFSAKLGKAGTTEGNSTIHAIPLFNGKVAFPVLESLDFKNLSKITRIWYQQPLSEQEKEAKSFCKLMAIKVEDCDQMEYVLPSYMLPQLENLEELHIERCRKMEVIISNNPQEKEATNNNDTIRFPQLKEVLLVGLPNLKSFICSDETQLFFSNKVTFPVLEIFVLAELDKITRIWNNQPLSEQEKEAKSFSELKSIYVVRCEHLEYVLPFYMLSQLKNLQELGIWECWKMEVIISNNPKEKEATNNNDTIRFPLLKKVKLGYLPNLKSFICSETQLFFSNKDAFPVLDKIKLRPRGTLEFLGNETSTEDVSMEEWEWELESEWECGTSREESDHNGEEFDEDLKTSTKKVSVVEECSTSGKENDHNGEELDEDLETLTKEASMEECGTSGPSGKENEHNGEQG